MWREMGGEASRGRAHGPICACVALRCCAHNAKAHDDEVGGALGGEEVGVLRVGGLHVARLLDAAVHELEADVSAAQPQLLRLLELQRVSHERVPAAGRLSRVEDGLHRALLTGGGGDVRPVLPGGRHEEERVRAVARVHERQEEGQIDLPHERVADKQQPLQPVLAQAAAEGVGEVGRAGLPPRRQVPPGGGRHVVGRRHIHDDARWGCEPKSQKRSVILHVVARAATATSLIWMCYGRKAVPAFYE